MADEVREHEYDVAISLISFLSQAFRGQFKPMEANPVRQEKKRRTVLTPEQRKAEERDGWELMRKGLAWISQQRDG